MRVELLQNNKRKTYDKVSNALVHAYNEDKAVLVTQRDIFVCVFIPYNEVYTAEINEDGIDFVKGEFVEFDSEDLYYWEDCVFEVIDTDNISIKVERD